MEGYLESQQILYALGDLENYHAVSLNIGSVEKSSKQYDSALTRYQEALTYYTKTDNKKNIANTLASMGSIYRRQCHYEQALESNLEAEIAEESRKMVPQKNTRMSLSYLPTLKASPNSLSNYQQRI